MGDVLIVGAGPAGSGLALLLARRGLRVTLFDRARFPREKPCGEAFGPGVRAFLASAGLTLPEAELTAVLETLDRKGTRGAAHPFFT